MATQDPQRIPFTADKFAQIKAEIKRLEAERKEVMKRLQAAREMGDLSENGAYKYAKFELGDIGRKLRMLNFQATYGYVQKVTKTDTVQFGSNVTLSTGKKTITYMMVSEYESNPREGKLATTSPLGKVLMGKKAGDTVSFTAPVGVIEYLILKVA